MGYQNRVSISPIGFISDQGTFDARRNPLFPEAKRGDLYTISSSGVIGLDAIGTGLVVLEGDQIQCLEDNVGGFYANVLGSWIHKQTNVNGRLTEKANQTEVRFLTREQFSTNFVFFREPELRSYAIVNKNLIVPRQLELLPEAPERPLFFDGNVLKLPEPLYSGAITRTVRSIGDNFFVWNFSPNGVLDLQGTFLRGSERVFLNIPAYVAKTPLRFDEVVSLNSSSI